MYRCDVGRLELPLRMIYLNLSLVGGQGVMDPEWVAACNHALDTFRSDPSVVAKIGASELWQESDCSPKLLPAERDEEGGPLLEERMTGLEALPKPHCDHFRKMVPYAWHHTGIRT